MSSGSDCWGGLASVSAPMSLESRMPETPRICNPGTGVTTPRRAPAPPWAMLGRASEADAIGSPWNGIWSSSCARRSWFSERISLFAWARSEACPLRAKAVAALPRWRVGSRSKTAASMASPRNMADRACSASPRWSMQASIPAAAKWALVVAATISRIHSTWALPEGPPSNSRVLSANPFASMRRVVASRWTWWFRPFAVPGEWMLAWSAKPYRATNASAMQNASSALCSDDSS